MEEQQFSVTLDRVAEESGLTVAYTPRDLKEIKVYAAEVYRPGIMLAGYYQYFDSARIQIIGLTEMSYLNELEPKIRRTHLEKLFSFQPPAVVISRDMEPLPEMTEFAKQYGVALLLSSEMTSPLMSSMITTLNTELAPRITRHGVLVEVYGEGILIMGDSGVGKSETAIELVKRGHRLIADDAVELRRVSSHVLCVFFATIAGFFTAKFKMHWFISTMANMLIIFGLLTYATKGVSFGSIEPTIPSMVIPVMPGRNLAVILETAAMNNRSKEMGYNAARELLKHLGLENDF